MAISEVGICNMALGHVGANQIESLTEESVEALQCRTWYPFARKQLLEAMNWSFARKRQLLSLHGEDPPEGIWLFRYQYPSDCIAIREIENPLSPSTAIPPNQAWAGVWLTGDAIPFIVETASDETKSILTNMEEATGIYTFDLTNTTNFSSFFVMALSQLLAYYIAFPLTKKLAIKRAMLTDFVETMRAAEAQNANEGVDNPPRDAEWVRGRT